MISKNEVYEWYHSVKKKKIRSVDLEVVLRLKQELKKELQPFKFCAEHGKKCPKDKEWDCTSPVIFLSDVEKEIDEVFGVEGEK